MTERKTSVIQDETQPVNKIWQGLLAPSGTPWQYYQLSGVQAEITDCKISGAAPPKEGPDTTNAEKQAAGLQCITAQNNDASGCLMANPNYYMANLFVETD